jgi:hypothetical protein
MVVYTADLEHSLVALDGLVSECSGSDSRVDKVEASSQLGDASSSPSIAKTSRKSYQINYWISWVMQDIVARLGIEERVV